jgi:hypothetical protein
VETPQISGRVGCARTLDGPAPTGIVAIVESPTKSITETVPSAAFAEYAQSRSPGPRNDGRCSTAIWRAATPASNTIRMITRKFSRRAKLPLSFCR